VLNKANGCKQQEASNNFELEIVPDYTLSKDCIKQQPIMTSAYWLIQNLSRNGGVDITPLGV